MNGRKGETGERSGQGRPRRPRPQARTAQAAPRSRRTRRRDLDFSGPRRAQNDKKLVLSLSIFPAHFLSSPGIALFVSLRIGAGTHGLPAPARRGRESSSSGRNRRRQVRRRGVARPCPRPRATRATPTRARRANLKVCRIIQPGPAPPPVYWPCFIAIGGRPALTNSRRAERAVSLSLSAPLRRQRPPRSVGAAGFRTVVLISIAASSGSKCVNFGGGGRSGRMLDVGGGAGPDPRVGLAGLAGRDRGAVGSDRGAPQK